ncbi:MAG: hypothetical protein U0269_29470 [Polyangiales bacterium]
MSAAEIADRWVFVLADGSVVASNGYVGPLERLSEARSIPINEDESASVALHSGSMPFVDQRGQLWIVRDRGGLERIELPSGVRAQRAAGADARTVLVWADDSRVWRATLGPREPRWERVFEPFSTADSLRARDGVAVVQTRGGHFEWRDRRWVGVRSDEAERAERDLDSRELRSMLPVLQRRDGRTIFADGVERSADGSFVSHDALTSRWRSIDWFDSDHFTLRISRRYLCSCQRNGTVLDMFREDDHGRFSQVEGPEARQHLSAAQCDGPRTPTQPSPRAVAWAAPAQHGNDPRTELVRGVEGQALGFSLRCATRGGLLEREDHRTGEAIAWISPGAMVTARESNDGIELAWIAAQRSQRAHWSHPSIRADGLVKILAVGESGLLFSASVHRSDPVHQLYWAEANGTTRSLGDRSPREPAIAAIDDGPVTLSLAGDFTRYSRTGVMIERRTVDRVIGLLRQSGRWAPATEESVAHLTGRAMETATATPCNRPTRSNDDRLRIALSAISLSAPPYVLAETNAPSFAELSVGRGSLCVERLHVRGWIDTPGPGWLPASGDWFDSEPGGASIELDATSARTMRGRERTRDVALACSVR